jgi:hypothetical protein
MELLDTQNMLLNKNGNVISDPEMTKITKGCFLLLRSEMRS